MINKKMFIGACLLGVSLIFTACSSSSPAFPSQFHGTWVKTGDNTSAYKITGDEFSIKEDGGEYQSLQEFLDSIPEDDLKDYEIVQQPTYIDSDQSIVFAAGMKGELMGQEIFTCFTTYLSKDANEDKLNEYDIPINSVEDPSLTSLDQCKVEPLPDTSSTEPSNEYTKETDDSGGDSSTDFPPDSPAFPPEFQGTWVRTGDDPISYRITGDEFSIKQDGGEYQSLQEVFDSIPEDELKDYQIIQQPVYDNKNQSIVFAFGAIVNDGDGDYIQCLTSYLSKDANEDKLNEYDIAINSEEDPSLTSLDQCEFEPFPDTSSSTAVYTKVTDDLGGSN